MPSRRSVVKGAAWTVPVIAIAAPAPAYAASAPCASTTVTYAPATAAYSRQGDTSATMVFLGALADGTPAIDPVTGRQFEVTLSLTSALTSGPGNIGYGKQFPDQTQEGSVDSGPNLSYYTAEQRGGYTGAIVLHQHREHYDTSETEYRADHSTTTLAFSREVRNATVTISDIDSFVEPNCGRGDYYDAVDVSGVVGSGMEASYDPAYIDGQGTAELPWTSTTNDLPVPETSGAANVDLTFATLSSFELNYWDIQSIPNAGDTEGCTAPVDKDQTVFLTNITFQTVECL